MTDINIDTDFARITVTGKTGMSHGELLEHAMHRMMAEYREQYGVDATRFVLNKLEGYYGR